MIRSAHRNPSFNPLTACDFYKTDHRRQYPEGTQLVYSNFTPRSARHNTIPEHLFNGHVTFFGLQYFVFRYLQEEWTKNFFKLRKELVVRKYKKRMDTSLGEGAVSVEHIEALHDLGYLPLQILALPEGTQVPIGVPCVVLYNTHPEFFWLTNYIETILSCYLWKPITTATIAHHYKILLTDYARKTGADLWFVDFQGHDFSFRGMSGPEDAALSGAAHLLSFKGTDTIPAIDLLEDMYFADPYNELVGTSVPATEHSVMCMGTQDSEIETFKRLITKIYPKGIVSIVSDTWDFWKVVTDYAAQLKIEIMQREGKVVFRPDSGDPVKIICGDWEMEPYTAGGKGAVQCLWDIFGGTINEKGFKVLDPHVGLIYGDSITLERAQAILHGLEHKGFASSNIVFGIGSYTYQHVTRDTFGFAVKSTYGVVKGEGREIFKDPITDNGTKKSAKGLLAVVEENGKLVLKDQQSSFNVDGDKLESVYLNGVATRKQTLAEIRALLSSN